MKWDCRKWHNHESSPNFTETLQILFIFTFLIISWFLFRNFDIWSLSEHDKHFGYGEHKEHDGHGVFTVHDIDIVDMVDIEDAKNPLVLGWFFKTVEYFVLSRMLQKSISFHPNQYKGNRECDILDDANHMIAASYFRKINNLVIFYQ